MLSPGPKGLTGGVEAVSSNSGRRRLFYVIFFGDKNGPGAPNFDYSLCNMLFLLTLITLRWMLVVITFSRQDCWIYELTVGIYKTEF